MLVDVLGIILLIFFAVLVLAMLALAAIGWGLSHKPPNPPREGA